MPLYTTIVMHPSPKQTIISPINSPSPNNLIPHPSKPLVECLPPPPLRIVHTHIDLYGSQNTTPLSLCLGFCGSPKQHVGDVLRVKQTPTLPLLCWGVARDRREFSLFSSQKTRANTHTGEAETQKPQQYEQ